VSPDSSAKARPACYHHSRCGAARGWAALGFGCYDARGIATHMRSDAGSDQIVRGSVARAVRKVGGAMVVLAVLLALWLVVKETAAKKLAVFFAFIAVAILLLAYLAIAAATAIAEIKQGRLSFYAFGRRIHSFPLDSTTFEIHPVGRLRVLVISSDHASYVPEGTLDQEELVQLLRANGVAEEAAK